MIAKSLLESSKRSDRGKSTLVSSGVETGDDVTLMSADEGRGNASWSATGAAVVSGSEFSIRALRRLTDHARVVDFRGSSGDSDFEWLSYRDANDAAMRALRAAGLRPDQTKALDEADDDDDAPVVFVVLMPKSVRDGRYREPAVEPSRLMTGVDNRAKVTGPAPEVDLPSAISQSGVGDLVLTGLEQSTPFARAGAGRRSSRPDAAAPRMPELTPREREVLKLILEGHPNKNIAADLRISRRTVENHRAKLMKKTGSRSLPALVRLAIAAGAMPDASPVAPR